MKIYKMGNKLGLYFPKKKLEYNKGELLLLTIKKNSIEEKLIVKFNYNIIIRNQFIKNLKLKKNDIIDISLEKIQNLERTKKLFYKNKIDLLSLIPKKTSQNYEIIIYPYRKEGNEWLKLWYLHERGSGNQLEIKRFVDIKKFGSLLGQYQAEGTKPVNSKYPKYRVEFTNKIINEHKEFLESLIEIGIKRESFKARFTYNPLKFSEEKAKIQVIKFEKEIKIKPSSTKLIKAKGIGFKFSVNNTILLETILNSLETVRNSFNKNIKNKEYRILIENFFAKLLTGDGTLSIRTKNREYGYPTTRIKVVDQDFGYLESYKKLMENFNLSPKIKRKHIFVKASTGLHDLLFLYKIKAFKNSRNWNKLILNIDLMLNGRRHSTFKRYLDLVNYETFDTLKISEDYKVGKRAAHDWLSNATKEGYIKKLTEKTQPILWTTTNKAKKLANILESWQKDLIKLKKEKGIEDSLSLLNTLKIKGKVLSEEGS